MLARFRAYNDNCDFSLYTFWGDGYKTVFYEDIELSRPRYEDFSEEVTDELGNRNIVYQSSTEIYEVDVLAVSPIVRILKDLGKHRIIDIFLIETQELFVLKNVEFRDNGTNVDGINSITLSFEMELVISGPCCDEELQLGAGKQAFWDLDDDGTKDIDGDTLFLTGSADGVFRAWQLYYELDGVTPATDGTVTMEMTGVRKDSSTFSIGTFVGELGDSLDDNTKWATGVATYSPWNYFDAGSTIDHTGQIQFSKKLFAQDFNFLGTETTDEAIKIEMTISMDGSLPERMTMQEVYSLLSSYCNNFASSNQSRIVQVLTGKQAERPTLATYTESRENLSTSAVSNFNTFSFLLSTPVSNVYDISPLTTAQEHYSDISGTTNAGFTFAQKRAVNDTFDYSIGVNTTTANPIVHTSDVITGLNVFNITFSYWVQLDSGKFPIMDAINNSASFWYLNGVQQAGINTTVGTHNLFVVLPDTNIHTIKLETESLNGYEISCEFQIQLIRFF